MKPIYLVIKRNVNVMDKGFWELFLYVFCSDQLSPDYALGQLQKW